MSFGILKTYTEDFIPFSGGVFAMGKKKLQVSKSNSGGDSSDEGEALAQSNSQMLASMDEPSSKKVKVEAGKSRKVKNLFRRSVWSEEHEIIMLKGMLEYKEENQVCPTPSVFYEFIKDSLNVGVQSKQIGDKLHKLKTKYINNLGKSKIFESSHEQICFDLSHKLWETELQQQRQRKTKTKPVSSNMDMKEEEKEESWQFIGKSPLLLGLDENVMRMGLGLCSHNLKAELEYKWKELFVEEHRLYLKKLDLAHQESQMITEALRSGRDK